MTMTIRISTMQMITAMSEYTWNIYARVICNNLSKNDYEGKITAHNNGVIEAFERMMCIATGNSYSHKRDARKAARELRKIADLLHTEFMYDNVEHNMEVFAKRISSMVTI